MFGDFYGDESILVTGHTGFKGAWLSLWLRELGARVHGFSIGTVGRPSFYETLGKKLFESDARGDVRDLGALKKLIRRTKPRMIFHLAAQPLVRRSYQEPLETLTTNALGTANVLEAVRLTGCAASIIVVTTDKCYENRNLKRGYREADPLGGHDVYSASKAAAEVVAHSWRRSFFETDPGLGRVATARGGNVIGGGDYAVDRIVPDFVRALMQGQALEIRNPAATRPWQHVLDCLSGYLALGARLVSEPKNTDLAAAFNFGPKASSHRTVRDLIESALRTWPGKWKSPKRSAGPHEAKLLHLSTRKASTMLDWEPVWSFENTVDQTMSWYRRRHSDKTGRMMEYSRQQLSAYTEQARKAGLAWAK